MIEKYRNIGIGIVLGVCLSLSCKTLLAEEMIKNEIIAELVNTITKFAQNHDLNDVQMESLLGEIVLNGPKLKKGGVGIVDSETFILLQEERNSMSLAEKKWQGEKVSESEIVLTDGRRVIGSMHGVDVSKLKIVMFSPAEVRYINLSNNTGGKYSR